MSSDSWNDIEELFAEALELDPAARTDWLAVRCAGRPALCAEVESLLASHEASGGFLREPTLTEGRIGEPRPLGGAGLTIGRYRLLEKIGEGGMGVVYGAERADGEFTERVAVKLIPMPLHHADALRRFRVERQVLATLNHPDIVTLIDSGLTEAGQAYLVMKHVDGVPITDFCSTHGLDIEARIRLFQRVAAAVQHAHQTGIVHRDLKPANVLVTADGIPKVLDFGIAKLLDPAGHAIDKTGTNLARPLTPNYASPEQLRGLPVTTACDVYALGVLLYESLTGARPYDTTGKPLDEVLAIVVDREPRRPSAAPGLAARETRRLRGDLDAIVLKAMSKEPARRYGSAQELSEDLSRHLARQPVLAREPSLVYYAGRMGRRHRAAFLAAAVSLVALMAALAVSLWQTRVARGERDRATQRFNDVRHLANALIFKIHDEVRPLAGSTPVRRTILSEALTYLERLRADPTADEALRLELARAYHRIGVVQGSMSGPNLGERERASQSFQYAVKLLRPLAASGANRQEAELELGRTALDLSNSLVDRDNAAAIAAAREALTLAESLVRRAPADEAARRLLGSAHFAMATRFVLTEVALPHWSRAGEMFEALLAERPDDPDRQRNVALVNKYLGAHYQFAGDLPRALAHNLRALELDERRVSADPANRQAQIDLAIDLGNVAEVHRQTGRDRDAAEGYERSLVIRRRLSETDPKDDYARGRLAYVHVTLAPIYAALGRSADALRHGRAGLTIADARAGIDERNRLELIDYLQVIGRMEKRLSLPRDGCAHLRRAAVLSRDVDLAKLKGRPTLAQDLANALAACGG